MSVTLIVIGFIAAGLIIGLFATATAPVGYEDENGFHFGPEKGASLANRNQSPQRQLSGAPRLTPKAA